MTSSMKHTSMNTMQALSVAIALALTSAAAFAQVRQATPERASPHVQLDLNHDGVIDRGEAAKAPRLAGRFDQLDTNKDGKLSADERAQMDASAVPRCRQGTARWQSISTRWTSTRTAMSIASTCRPG